APSLDLIAARVAPAPAAVSPGPNSNSPPALPGEGKGWVCLSVRDTGHGMDESLRARIFDPFFSTKERGSGLGLAVVRQIVESFTGRVQVWSEPGVGTVFDVWLPRA